MSNDLKEFARQGRTSPRERSYYVALIGLGLLLAVVSIGLEFTAVPDPDTHGMWTTFAMLGLGIAFTFGVIVNDAKP